MELNLTDNETIVYNAIKVYLQKKRAIKTDVVLNFLKKEINKSSIKMNPKKIQQILRDLINRNIIAEGSQLTKEHVLDIPKRLTIYQYILYNPGVYAYQITQDLNISSPVVIWHLSILEEFEFVKTIVFDGHLIYFESKIDLSEVKIQYYLRRDKTKKILNAINHSNDGLTKTKLSRDLNIHPSTIKKYIKNLCELEILFENQVDNKTIYVVNIDNLRNSS